MKKLSTRGPTTLFVVVLVLTAILTVLWNVVLVHDYQKLRELAAQSGALHGTLLGLGSALFLTIIVLSSILGAQLLSHIRWRQRQSQFIASVSHELNSPLSAIKLFAQTLRKADLEQVDRLDFVDKILEDVERLKRLISNILRAAEVDKGGADLAVILQDVELFSYLRDYLADAELLYQGSGLSLTLEADTDVWVELDRMMFRQVLDNLIDNAVRYRGEGSPQVHLTVRQRGGMTELMVRDNGIGVVADELPKLFERFYRCEVPGRQPSKGTGIGLYVVRSIVEAHGGKVSAASAGIGHGTTLLIQLPAFERQLEAA